MTRRGGETGFHPPCSSPPKGGPEPPSEPPRVARISSSRPDPSPRRTNGCPGFPEGLATSNGIRHHWNGYSSLTVSSRAGRKESGFENGFGKESPKTAFITTTYNQSRLGTSTAPDRPSEQTAPHWARSTAAQTLNTRLSRDCRPRGSPPRSVRDNGELISSSVSARSTGDLRSRTEVVQWPAARSADGLAARG